MSTFEIRAPHVERLARDMALFRKQAVPHATRAALNNTAFQARQEYQEEIRESLVLRSPWTVRSVVVRKATGLNVAAQQALMGSLAHYMDDQEAGATHTKSGKHGEPIPAAAPGQRKNRRKVPRSKQFKGLRLMPRVPGSRSRQIGAAFEMARRRGGKQFAFLRISANRRGIFEVNPRSKRRGLRKVWDLSKSSVRIPPNPMMGPALVKTERAYPSIWKEALLFQIRRGRLFRSR